MSFIDLFSDAADRYAAARPTYPVELFEFIARNAPALDRVWDCGTGNGQAAVGLARHFKSVWATDPSQAQIEHAIPNSRVIYSRQPAEAVDFPDASVDAVTVAQAFHWFDDEAFFAEACRVLKRSGFFCAWGYSWSHVDTPIDAVVQQTILQPLAKYWAPQNRRLWDGYKDMRMPFQAVTVPAFSIRMDWTLLEYMAYVHTWSATRLAIQAEGPTFFETALDEMERVWTGRTTVRRVTMPLAVVAGRRA